MVALAEQARVRCCDCSHLKYEDEKGYSCPYSITGQVHAIDLERPHYCKKFAIKIIVDDNEKE